MHTQTQIDRDIAIRKFSKIKRRALTAAEAARGLAAQVRALTDELGYLQSNGVPPPSANAIAASEAPAVAAPARGRRGSRVPPSHRMSDDRGLSFDPKNWVARWNEEQARMSAIFGELEELEAARDAASAEFQQTCGLATACRDYLAKHQIRVEI